MATKKTAKKTTDPVADKTVQAPEPVAKKAVKAANKVAAKKTATKTAPKAAAKPTPAKPSPDVIARAAYLNYRRRVEQGLPGDSHGDWLEAERYFSRTSET